MGNMMGHVAVPATSNACSRRRIRPVFRWRGGVILAVLGFLFIVATASPAAAHGGDPSKEGYLLVQQALGNLAENSGPDGMALAMESVDAAMAAEDHDGVAIATVQQAKQALGAGQVKPAEVLLQSSITQALSELGPAKGEETGTTVMRAAQPGRNGLTGTLWGFLIVSVLFVFAGLGLAFRFRPADTISDLRRRLGPSGATAGGIADNPARGQGGLR